MKKIIALLLALMMVISMVACSKTDVNVPETTEPIVTEPAEETTAPEETVETPQLKDTEQMLIKLAAACPVQFPVMTWFLEMDEPEILTSYTGLSNFDDVVEIAVTEPMMSAQAFSVVLVKVADGADAEAIAEEMRNGINMAKWICVQADNLDVVVVDNYVLLAMMSDDFADYIVSTDVTAAFVNMMENGEMAESAVEVAVPESDLEDDIHDAEINDEIEE